MSVRTPEQITGNSASISARKRGTSLVDCGPPAMALPFGETPGARDARALSILAKTIYRELRASGFQARDVIAVAGELLAQVTREMRGRSGTVGSAQAGGEKQS
jgi:hypothetical protein